MTYEFLQRRNDGTVRRTVIEAECQLDAERVFLAFGDWGPFDVIEHRNRYKATDGSWWSIHAAPYGLSASHEDYDGAPEYSLDTGSADPRAFWSAKGKADLIAQVEEYVWEEPEDWPS